MSQACRLATCVPHARNASCVPQDNLDMDMDMDVKTDAEEDTTNEKEDSPAGMVWITIGLTKVCCVSVLLDSQLTSVQRMPRSRLKMGLK